MSQTAYSENPGMAFAGMMADSSVVRDIISRINAAPQVWTVVVTTTANAEIFTVTIDGTAYAYTSDTNGTKTEITAGLKVLIDAGGESVDVYDDTTDTLTLTSTTLETEVTVTVTSPATGLLTLAEAVDFEDVIPFGAVVVADEATTASSAVSALTGKADVCRLPYLAADVTSPTRILGVAIADTSMITRSSAPLGGYDAAEVVPVLRKGRIWMTVEDIASVVAGGLVYVRYVATGTEALGAIRAADDGSDTAPVPQDAATFTGQVSGTVAVVEWNLP